MCSVNFLLLDCAAQSIDRSESGGAEDVQRIDWSLETLLVAVLTSNYRLALKAAKMGIFHTKDKVLWVLNPATGATSWTLSLWCSRGWNMLCGCMDYPAWTIFHNSLTETLPLYWRFARTSPHYFRVWLGIVISTRNLAVSLRKWSRFGVLVMLVAARSTNNDENNLLLSRLFQESTSFSFTIIVWTSSVISVLAMANLDHSLNWRILSLSGSR